MKQYKTLALLLAVFLLFTGTTVHAQTPMPVVHAVLFYSPTCGHCEYVITQTILPMMDQYGSQLQIIGINVTQEQGQKLFLSALQTFKLEQSGVPFLVIDDMYLVGSGDIPEQFPGLVESYLAKGGVDYPNIPGLQEIISQHSPTVTPTTTDIPTTEPSLQGMTKTPQPALAPDSVTPAFSTPTATAAPDFAFAHDQNISWTDRFAHDPAGNTLSVIVLLGMLGVLGWVIAFWLKGETIQMPRINQAWIPPLLCAVGFGVAGYLAFVEMTETSAVCGPVGDCNTVQQSEYARLFGILPIGVLGLFGYVLIFALWLVGRTSKEQLAEYANLFVFVLALLGTFFSIYLTFLEPFVIGATCAWCLTSAILMTALMLFTVRPAKAAFERILVK